MRIRSAFAVAVFVAVLAPAAARAQPEKYFVDDGFKPDGFFFGLFVQGGGFLSTSCCEIGGRRGGGGGGFRFGTVATERLFWILQIEGAAVPIEDQAENIELNSHGTFTVGAMYYPLATLWVQAGLGIATYKIEETSQLMQFADLERSGFAFSSSVGFDILRWPNAWSFGFSRQDLALSFEVRVVGGLYPGGTTTVGVEQKTGGILQITSGLGLQWY